MYKDTQTKSKISFPDVCREEIISECVPQKTSYPTNITKKQEGDIERQFHLLSDNISELGNFIEELTIRIEPILSKSLTGDGKEV